MRKWVVVIAILAALFAPLSASAQSEVSINTLNVELWPEYDRPDMLVIYHLTLAADTLLPTEISLPIPQAAGDPHVVAVGQTLQTVSDQNVNFKLEEDGEWTNVKITMTGPALQLEYYIPLEKDFPARHFSLTLQEDYDISDLTLGFRLPVDGHDLLSSLPLKQVSAGQNDQLIYEGEYGQLPAGKAITWTIDYQKDNNVLSIAGAKLEPTGPITSNISFSKYLPWILGGVGILLIAGGIVYYTLTGRRREKTARRRHARPKSEKKVETGEAVYCHQCGQRAQPGDRFCRICGTPLRREA
jgi:hypothetical protein